MVTVDLVVGVYDENQEVSACIKGVRQEVDIIVMPSTQGVALEQVIIDKEFFLDRSTCAVVVVNSVASISILMGAVRKLLEGAFKGVYVVSPSGIKPLLETTLSEGETTATEKLMTEGRLVSVRSFNEDKFSAWLTGCG